MSKKVISFKGKKWFAAYRNMSIFAKNKKRKLENHLKLFPNDAVTKKCLENGLKFGFDWKRKTPRTPMWSHTDKHHAGVWASLGHHGSKYIEYMKKLRTNTVNTVNKVSKIKEPNVQLD